MAEARQRERGRDEAFTKEADSAPREARSQIEELMRQMFGGEGVEFNVIIGDDAVATATEGGAVGDGGGRVDAQGQPLLESLLSRLVGDGDAAHDHESDDD